MPTDRTSVADRDLHFLERAVRIATAAEERGNLPIGCVITLDGDVMVEAGNSIYSPAVHPGRHAEVEALRQIPDRHWARAEDMTCYTTLEPCLMCFGALVLHGLGRVVWGARDPLGGATHLIAALPDYVRRKAAAMIWLGPAMPELCNPLCERALARVEQ